MLYVYFQKEHIMLTSPPTPGSVLRVKGSLYLRTPSPFGFGLVTEKNAQKVDS